MFLFEKEDNEKDRFLTIQSLMAQFANYSPHRCACISMVFTITDVKWSGPALFQLLLNIFISVHVLIVNPFFDAC